MRAGRPTARAIATYNAVCSLQSPTLVRSTSRADGRLTVGFLSSMPLTRRTSRSAFCRGSVQAGDRRLGLGADRWIVAFDQRLGAQVPRHVGIRGLGLQRARVDDLQDVAGDRLAGPTHVGDLEVGPFDANLDPPHVAGIVDAVLRRRCGGTAADSRRSPWMRAADRQTLRVFRGLAHGQQAERAFLADDFPGVGHPRRGPEPGERHLDAERRNRPVGLASHLARHRCRREHADDLALADVDRDGFAAQRRRVQDHELPLGARLEALRRETPRQVDAEHRPSGRSRSSFCVPLWVVMVRLTCLPETRPVTFTGPVPGSSENSNERSANS